MKRLLIFLVFLGFAHSQSLSSYPLEADFYESSHNYKKAIEVLKEGYRKEKNPEYLLRIAKDYLNLGQYRKAYKYAKLAYKKTREPGACITMVRSLIGLGKDEFAFSYLGKCIKKFPNDTAVIHFAANVYDAMDSLEKAIKFYEKLVPATQDTNVIIQYGSALVRAGYYEKAESLLIDVEKSLEEPDFRVEISLGTIYEKKKDYEKALIHYSKANMLQPSNLTIPMKMAIILMEMDSTAKALELLNELERIAPTSTRVRKLISLLSEKSGDRQRALTERLAAYAIEPDNPQDQYYIARYLINIGENRMAEKFLKKSIAKNPEPDNISLYAYLLLGEKRFRDARELLYHALERFPESAYLNSLTGYYFEQTGDYRLAHKYYKIALQHDSLNSKRYVDLALVMSKTGKKEDAIKLLERAREKFPNNRDILFNLGNLYGQTRNLDKMEEIYKELAKTDTAEIAVIMNNWGYFLAKYGVKLDFADSLINEALKREPNNPIFLDSKGWVEFQRGNYEKAYEFLKKAIDNGAKDPDIFEHMGEIYEKLGKPEDAIKWYERALKADPSKKYLKRRIKWLKKKL